VSVAGLPGKYTTFPDSLTPDFMDKFLEKFKVLDVVKTALQEEKEKGSKGAGNKRPLSDAEEMEESARKIQRKEAKKQAIHTSDLLLYNK
jgi:hypothetical protein